MKTNIPWPQGTFVSFDTETSGAYPMDSEICEIAAVKWKDGQIISQFESLCAVTKPMSDFIIGIHGITNEMVATAPKCSDVIRKFREFIGDAVMVAHHAPFDLGFVALEFEKLNLSLPDDPVICTSLLSRKIYTDFPNHKLQTLIPLLNITQGTAHRALDDSAACLQVALKCMEKLGADKTIDAVLEAQGGRLDWRNYSLKELRQHDLIGLVIDAIERAIGITLTYKGGLSPGAPRPIKPIGIVRNPDGDYVVGFCEREQKAKRYYINRIQGVSQIV